MGHQMKAVIVLAGRRTVTGKCRGVAATRCCTSCAGIASRLAHRRARGTLRGCRPACRSGRASGEIGRATQTFALRPTATAPDHSHARYDAWRAGNDMPRPQPTPNRRCVVAAIAEDTVRPMPRPPAFALQRGNRIHQRQRFLGVVPVRAGQANRERHTLSVADQMALAPALGTMGGIRAGLVTPVHRADGTTIHDCQRPIDLLTASEPIQQDKVDQIPPRPLPIAQAPPARHSRSAPEFLWEQLPGNVTAKDEDNASEACAIRNARPRTFGPSWWNRQQRFDKTPQRIWTQRGGHTRPRYLADEVYVPEGFVTRS